MTTVQPSSTATEEAPANHSLLKKGGQDDQLMRAYQKVERKLDAMMGAHLSDIIECKVKAGVGEAAKLSFADWLSAQASPSVYLKFHLGAAEGAILVRIARTFLSASVDCFFGGQFDGQAFVAGDLKASEIAMIDRLAGSISTVLTGAWSVLCETPVRYCGCYVGADEVELELDNETVLVSAGSVTLSGHQIAAMDIVQTLDGLMAIEPQLNRPHQKATDEIDPVWKADLRESVEQIYLPVRSVLGRPTMRLSELSRLAVGDILPVAPTDNVPLIIGDRVFAHGSIGEQNGGVAFQIKTFL
ncbi:FliM/FliN family flagellar motor switch protein [Parasphingorhabdus sp.]|uniref:FliM/FliN family flagellar motor switch protein n=1 Tax=Parasphingorhabdus sp. TaxID=2709688 RepID=UPI003002DA41